jgi:PAS domain S-box-containing protein
VISFAAQGRFAAEFLAFLVAVAGLALVGLRAELLSEHRVGRGVLAIGFGGLAGTSFLQGTLIIHNHSDVATELVRLAALLAILLGSLRWAGTGRSLWLLRIGTASMAAAIGLLVAKSEFSADILLGVGAAVVGVALRVASSRSIAARVAASSAAILLAVILVLAVSLSAVISTTVRDDAGRRLDARAALEADFAQTIQPAEASVVARNVGLTFSSNQGFEAATNALVNAPNPDSGTLPTIGNPSLYAIFQEIQSFLSPDLAIAYINAHTHVYALSAPKGFPGGIVGAAIGSPGVKQAFSTPTEQERAAVQTFGATAFVVAVQTVAIINPSGQTTYPTAVVAVQLLSNDYLRTRMSVDQTVALALVDRTAVLAESGSPGSSATLLKLAGRSLNAGGSPLPLDVTQGRILSTRPILAGSDPVAVIIASTPDTVVTNVRDKLLRTLFLLAMAGTVLALALAAYAGERVSGSIRVLTEAARRIQLGNFDELSGVRSEDEVGVLGVAFDSMALSISEQTAALQTAAEEETALRSQLEAVVAGMGEALVAVDENGRVTLFNRSAEEMLGVNADDVIGGLVGEALDAIAEDGTSLTHRLDHPTPARWLVTATVASQYGTRIPVAIGSGALRGLDGGVAGAVLVLRDLRPERQVERLKSQFLSRIGHELRTPLTSILGYAEILLRRPVPDARAREMHQQIVDGGRRLYRVVQMLEFTAAAEAGRSLLRSEAVDVKAVVDEVVGEWSGRVNGNHTLARRVPRRLPEIRGDRRWLAMAIDELIDNAVKFSPDGGAVTVAVSSTTFNGNGSASPAVQISVSDHGVGMTPAERRDAFAEFVQGDGSDTRRFGGLGLGLSLVKQVAEAHGGAVTVESTPTKGSKFSIIIPALPND